MQVINFKHKKINKYTRVARGEDVMEVMSVIDFVWVRRDILKNVHDGKAVRRIDKIFHSIILYCEKLSW